MKKLFLLIIFLSLCHARGWSGIPEKPEPPRLVNDLAGIFAPQQAAVLEQTLVQFANETSTQIVLVTVRDLEGYDPGDYAFRLGEKWGIGQKDKDNGVVILLKPKTDESRGQVFIAVGYGLEHVVPDAVANREIIDNEMIPRFREDDYFGGVSNGIKVIMDLARGEYTADKYTSTVNQGQGDSKLIGVVVFIILLLFFISISRKNRFYSPGKNVSPWIWMSMLGSGRSSHGGSWGGFSGGGGSGGGGFGGFGGGGFGGGGAGGSW